MPLIITLSAVIAAKLRAAGVFIISVILAGRSAGGVAVPSVSNVEKSGEVRELRYLATTVEVRSIFSSLVLKISS